MMKKIRVGINGFGRIGRAIWRASLKPEYSDIQVVHINDLTDVKTLAYLAKYDSVHGQLPWNVTHTEDTLYAKDIPFKVSAVRSPADLPWKTTPVDVVFECTGLFSKREEVDLHLRAGAPRVLISAPATGEDLTVVHGVNSDRISSEHKVLSNGSCTTNCLAPVTKVLHEALGITSGLMTTVHSYTNDQRVLDIPHKDLRRSRACALSMIPTSTGAAKAIGLVIPELKGKIDGLAVRVPTPNVSLVDVTFTVEKKTTVEEVNTLLTRASQTSLKGILGVTNDEVVSVDFNGSTESSFVDLSLTKVIGDRLVKVLSWYDNETGFSHRMLDVARVMLSRSSS